MPYQEKSLFSDHLLAAWKAENELPSADIRPRIDVSDAGLLEQLPYGCLLERFAAFKAAARGRPVGLACKGIVPVDEA